MMPHIKCTKSVTTIMTDSNLEGEEGGHPSGPHVSIPLNGTVHDRGNAFKNPIPSEDLPPEIQRFLSSGRGRDRGSRKTIQILEGVHVLSLLIFVSNMSPVIKTDIHAHVSRCAGMNDKIDDLAGLGLLKVYHTARNNTNIVVITEKGKEVADRLQAILDYIDGAPEDTEGTGRPRPRHRSLSISSSIMCRSCATSRPFFVMATTCAREFPVS